MILHLKRGQKLAFGVIDFTGWFGVCLTQFLLYYEVADTWHVILSFC
jgi:hypothetical protein